MVLCMHVSTRLVIDCYPWVWGIYFYAFRDAASGGILLMPLMLQATRIHPTLPLPWNGPLRNTSS